MNHDMRVGTIVLLREDQLVGVAGYRRRQQAGHVLDHKYRPWVVVSTDAVGMTVMPLSSSGKPFPSAFPLADDLRVGTWRQGCAPSLIRDVRRPAVIVWGSPAAGLVRRSGAGFDLYPVATNLMRVCGKFKVPFVPSVLLKEIASE